MKSNAKAGLLLLAGAGAILVAAGLSWFLQNFEIRDQEVDVGYSAAARRNPFLAAERFLRRLEVPVESHAGRDLLRDLPPPEDTLVVRALGPLNTGRRQALHRWIERGGRLIVQATTLREEPGLRTTHPDGFLDRYGVHLIEIEDPKDRNTQTDDVIAEVSVLDYAHLLQVGFSARFFLEDASGNANGAVIADERPRLLQYEIGEGVLTVVSDSRFLTNQHIGRYDHALFLLLLASPRAEGNVRLLYDSSMPWLGALIWHGAPFAVTSFLCLLALFLWHLGKRLGPLLPPPVSDRRDLLAHLEASAGFLWRHGQGGPLTAATRERVERAWLRCHPTLRELDKEGRARWIARRSGLVSGEVRRALYPVAWNEGDFVADAALLQVLWSRLSAPQGATGAAVVSALVHNSVYAD